MQITADESLVSRHSGGVLWGRELRLNRLGCFPWLSVVSIELDSEVLPQLFKSGRCSRQSGMPGGLQKCSVRRWHQANNDGHIPLGSSIGLPQTVMG